MMIVHANQKIVTVHKAPTNKDHIYGTMNKAVTFRNFSGLTLNEIKAYTYLCLNQDGYCMALSPEDMANKLGSSTQCMQTAVRGLVTKGYLVKNHGKYYDFVEDPLGVAQEAEIESNRKNDVNTHKKVMVNNRDTNVYHEENRGEIIKEEYSKNTINYTDDDDLSNPKVNSKEWEELFGRIKVQCYPHTLKRLENVVGTELDARVVGKIVNDKWSAFENKMFEQEGYRLNTLVNLLEANYTKYKYAIAAQDAEYRRAIEESRNQPRIDYDLLCASRRKEHEGLDDISALLDEMFEDYDDAV